ncbi:MAG: ComEC/Rec2 family competence protein [Anaerolineaceae bacterium]|nr:ComEC/Rec2 family competence protein [Anaerolineaceae bacterium]MDE0330067.1 ComEC/Rec2 family competence protein [Anaerolineaceae bacterium]
MRLIYLSLGWVCGIVLAANNPHSSFGLAQLWLVCGALAVVCVLLLWNRWGWYALALLALTLGGLRMSLVPTDSEVAMFNNLGGVSVEGVVSDAPLSHDSDVQVRLAASVLIRDGRRFPVQGEVLVLAAAGTPFAPGDHVRATGLLQRPGEFDSFSWNDYLARSGVFSIMREASVELLAASQGVSLQSILYDLNRRAGRQITASLPAPWSALLKGILLGDESGLAPDLRGDFNATGAAHVIAISGFNMIVLSGAVLALLRRSRLAPAATATVAILTILMYAILVGAGAAVMRAALMSCLLVIAGAMRRRVFTPASLAFAVLLLSLLNPTVLWDIGLQLSALATLGIMLLASPLAAALQRIVLTLVPSGARRAAQALLVEPFAVSLAAYLATFPLILRYFGRMSLLALPVNLLIVPAQAPLLIVGLLATVTAFLAPLPAQLLYWLGLLPLGWTVGVVRTAARLPMASVEIQTDPRLVAALYLGLLLAALIRFQRHRFVLRLGRLLVNHASGVSALLLATGLALLLIATRLSRPDNLLHLWLLDVGHVNAILLQGPAGEHILIDGGSSPSRLMTAIGERLPFHDRRLEMLAVTVPDPATLEALQSLLQRYDLGLLLHNGQRELPATLVQAADAVITPVKGHTLHFGKGLEIDVLHPQARPTPDERQMNRNALVLRVRYGSVSILLPGTLNREGQREMLASADLSPATVLQLPLQGAPRSLEPEFLLHTGAQLALLHTDPDDLRNRHGSPDPEVLNLLGDTPLLHSDGAASTHLWSDGVNLWRDHWPQEQTGD